MKTILVEISDQEEEDTINNEVETIDPTSGTDTHKTDDKLIISDSGKDYDDLVTDQCNLNDCIEENDDKRKKKSYY